MRAAAALGASLRAQMPDTKHVVATIRPGEGAVAFVDFLESADGVEALGIECNPALQHLSLVLWGAGNDLYWTDRKHRPSATTRSSLYQMRWRTHMPS